MPTPAAERADRFGAYNWGIDYGAYPGDAGGNDRLNWGAGLVAESGSRAIRVWLGARDIYYVNSPRPCDLVREASGAAYDRLFRDPRFKTYLLTVYSRADMSYQWADGYTVAEYVAERAEIRALGEYLLGNPNYAGKTFIILNWEGDGMMDGHGNKQSTWDNFTRWVQSRADGVSDARQTHPSQAARLYSALEFNEVRHSRTGLPCGTPVSDPVKEDPLRNRCVIDYVAPRVTVDYYSYSAYQSFYDRVGNPSLNVKEAYNRDLNFALSKVRTLRPEVGEHNFIIGEVGFPRTDFGECYAAETLRDTLEGIAAPDSFRVSYVILWQIVDNGPIWDGDGWPGFGMFRVRNGELQQTMSGRVFQSFLAGQQFSVPTDCPRVRRYPEPGILDSKTGTPDFRLDPDSVMAIYAQGCCQNSPSPFSATGNTVRCRQRNREAVLPRDNTQWFYESTTQINASIPGTRNPGRALVYVTDQRGIDSNGQYLELKCDLCPAIRETWGVLDAATQMDGFFPGSVISIYGDRFSPTNNQVIVEQFDNEQVSHTWTLQHDLAWSETATQITARLPTELITDRFAWLYVTDAQGRRSNSVRILISEACQACGPGLRPLLSIVNRISQKADFHPGTAIEIRGVNFSPSGNQVIVEQAGQRYVLSRSDSWSESPVKITASLPTALQAGHAIIYLIDSGGRESRAISLTITSTPLANVSAASYSASALAAEAIAAAFGTSLATEPRGVATTPLPVTLAGTNVYVKDSQGITRLARLFFVSPTQVNYQVPPGTAPGPATVTITSGDGSISTGTVQITMVAPGLFTADASGSGTAAAFVVRVRPDNSQTLEPVARFDPLQNRLVPVPIDLGPESEQVFLALFGTGFRARSSEANVMVRIAGIDAPVTYAGDQLQLIGLDQINVRLPRALIGRGDSAVEVTVDGKAANPVRVTIR
ncbi:MAG TPA: hypothetical protein VNQ79_03655 [Blastocatellia bacterium]|nr:hypothetical protein [Blastocatellia bacterium]